MYTVFLVLFFLYHSLYPKSCFNYPIHRRIRIDTSLYTIESYGTFKILITEADAKRHGPVIRTKSAL